MTSPFNRADPSTPLTGMADRRAELTRPSVKMFSLKKWNAVAMWSWDVECDTCAICRVQVMDACLRCQAENKQEDCVVVWGECNHSFHNCCMSLWVKQNNRCPLCQQDWVVQRIGK
ncbi:RING-box protein 2 [Ranitomeya imitator]|uniref:RING-box protein 2 n=2 Tax=Hyloidea TaxID=8417 RepID=UPI001AA97187